MNRSVARTPRRSFLVSRVVLAAVCAVVASSAPRLSSADGLESVKSPGTSTSFAFKGDWAAAGRGGQAEAVEAFFKEKGDELGLDDPFAELELVRDDAFGKSGRLVFGQTYKGVPVLHAEFALHMNAGGAVTYGSGTLVPTPRGAATEPAVTAAEATTKVVEAWKREFAGQGEPTVFNEARLVIVSPKGTGAVKVSAPMLAWTMKVGHPDLPADRGGVVDATTGAVVAMSNDVAHQAAPEQFLPIERRIEDCTSQIAFGGVAGPGACRSADREVYIEERDEYHRYGRIEGGPAPLPNPFLATSSDPYTADVNALYELLPHFHNLMRTSFGRNGANGFGGLGETLRESTASAYADFANMVGSSDNCPNAWTTKTKIMFCKGMTQPEIVGHEYFHKVMDSMFLSAQGGETLSISGETRSINEASADIFSEIDIEQTTQDADWIVGAESPSKVRRSLRNPPEDLSSGNPVYRRGADSTYSVNFDCSCAGPSNSTGRGCYDNSGVFAKAFYLIVNGGQFEGCGVSALGPEKGKQLLFRAWSRFFSTGQTFRKSYDDINAACHSLITDPVASTTFSVDDCRQVTKALKSVAMDEPGKCSTEPRLNATPQCEDVTPTPAPTATAAPTATSIPTATAVPTATSTPTPTATPAATSTATATPTASPSPTSTPGATVTPLATPTRTPAATATPTPRPTLPPTATPLPTATARPTPLPTAIPSPTAVVTPVPVGSAPKIVLAKALFTAGRVKDSVVVAAANVLVTDSDSDLSSVRMRVLSLTGSSNLVHLGRGSYAGALVVAVPRTQRVTSLSVEFSAVDKAGNRSVIEKAVKVN